MKKTYYLVTGPTRMVYTYKRVSDVPLTNPYTNEQRILLRYWHGLSDYAIYSLTKGHFVYTYTPKFKPLIFSSLNAATDYLERWSVSP